MVSDKEFRKLISNTELIGFILIDLYKKTGKWNELSEAKKKSLREISNFVRE